MNLLLWKLRDRVTLFRRRQRRKGMMNEDQPNTSKWIIKTNQLAQNALLGLIGFRFRNAFTIYLVFFFFVWKRYFNTIVSFEHANLCFLLKKTNIGINLKFFLLETWVWQSSHNFNWRHGLIFAFKIGNLYVNLHWNATLNSLMWTRAKNVNLTKTPLRKEIYLPSLWLLCLLTVVLID